MSEDSRRGRNQNRRQSEEFKESRDYLNQPKGKFEDLFKTSKSDKEHSKPSNTEKPPESERSG